MHGRIENRNVSPACLELLDLGLGGGQHLFGVLGLLGLLGDSTRQQPRLLRLGLAVQRVFAWWSAAALAAAALAAAAAAAAGIAAVQDRLWVGGRRGMVDGRNPQQDRRLLACAQRCRVGQWVTQMETVERIDARGSVGQSNPRAAHARPSSHLRGLLREQLASLLCQRGSVFERATVCNSVRVRVG